MIEALYQALYRALIWLGVIVGAAILTHWLTAGTDEITNPNLDGPSYGASLAAEHDCWTASDGRTDLPSAAVVTMRDDVAPRYTTNPAEVDKAFRAALGESVPSVYSVTALCLDN